MRTTSSLESENSQIQRSFPQNPSIYQFAEHLKLHESMKSTDMYQLINTEITSERLRRKRKIDRERDIKIKHISAMLKNNQISVENFLEVMSDNEMIPKCGRNKLYFLIFSYLDLEWTDILTIAELNIIVLIIYRFSWIKKKERRTLESR